MANNVILGRDRTGQDNLTFKLGFPGNLWLAAFAILAMFWIFLDLPQFSFITGAICGTVRISWEITKEDRRGRDKRLWACKCTAEVRNGLIQARCSPCWLHDKIDATWIVQNHVMRRKNWPEIFLERAFFDASHVSRETMEYRLIISRWSTIVCIQEERGRLGK